MNKLILILSLVLIALNVSSQINETEYVERIGKDILVGKYDRQGLQLPTMGDWYKLEYEAYNPSKRIVKKLKKQSSEDITITIVLGTWCHDSRREVPRFFKVLDQLEIDEKKVLMYGADFKKKVKGLDIESLNIQRVPTFIIYRNGIEIGRIIESPRRSLEKDLLKIINIKRSKK